MVSERITFGGLASGIDTNSIIDQMLRMQSRPIRMAENRRSVVEERMKALGSLASNLSSLLNRTKALQSNDTFRARTTSVHAKEVDKNAFSASANSTAAVGSFQLHITQLATQTKAASTGPVGQAIDADAPLNEAGFSTGFKTGTFSINGTAFTIEGPSAASAVSDDAIGAGFDPAVSLSGASTDVVANDGGGGVFTINGVEIEWTVADSLQDVMTAINESEAGVSASYDEEIGGLRLTSNTAGAGTITFDDLTGNFMQVVKFLDGDAEPIAGVTAGADVASLNDVIAMINGAGLGVTAALVNDAHGRPNVLELTSASNIQLGSGGDTSNFLSITSLLQSPGGTVRSSVKGLGGLDASANLVDAGIEEALDPTGSFRVNGVAINYNANADSLHNVITRINGSGAGVTASYNAATDRITITHNESGSTAIQLEDVEGNFLDAFRILGTTQTVGQNAAYQVDGGPTQYSTSNTITDAVTGVTIVARDTTTEPVKVDIGLGTQSLVDTAAGFVTEFNKVLGHIRELTRYNEDGPNGILFGDGTARRIEQTMRSIIARAVPNLPGGIRTLSDVGISFGAVGAAVGTTNELTLDRAKLNSAMQSDPEAVRQLFAAFAGTATLEAGGTGAIESIAGSPTSTRKTGRYEINTSADGQLFATFIPNDGSAPTTSTGTITAGGTNSTLIPGVTITASDPLVEGSSIISIGATQEGVAKQLHEFVDSLARTGGLLDLRRDEMQGRISGINAQIDRLEERLAQREERLVRQFAAMEQAFMQVQSQQQALTQMQQQLANLRPPQRR